MLRSKRSSAVLLSIVGGSILLNAGFVEPAGAEEPIEAPALIATVDGDSITTRELDDLLQGQTRPEAGSANEIAISAEGVYRRLLQNRLLEQEAYRSGLQEAREIQGKKYDLMSHRAVIAMLDSIATTVPMPEFEKPIGPPAETRSMIRIAHILTGNEAVAGALLDSLQAGVPFADLAARHSIDTLWCKSGDGDLGWATEENVAPEFQAILDDLEDGEYGGPARSPRGWHVLRRIDSRLDAVLPDFRAAVQEAGEKRQEIVEAKADEFAQELRSKYEVVQHDSLLATLDYATADPVMKEYLRTSQDALVEFPWRTITVAALSRTLRFEYYHGLEGKADAEKIRDDELRKWVTEALFRREARARGFHEDPEVRYAGERNERRAIREMLAGQILESIGSPTLDEARAFYEENPDQFTPPPSVQAEGALLESAEAAQRFAEQLETGATVGWLSSRAQGLVDTDPESLKGPLSMSSLELTEERAVAEAVFGPLKTKDGWLAGRIVSVHASVPDPFEKCEARAMSYAGSRRRQTLLESAFSRLEEAATIEPSETGLDLIESRLQSWMGSASGPEKTGAGE